MRTFSTLIYLWSKFFKKIRGSAIVNSCIHKTSKVESGSQTVNVTMDRYSFCGYDCEINNASIGSFCSIANGVIIGGGMHPMNWVSTSPVFYEGRDSVKEKFSKHSRTAIQPVIIGHDVWIGQNSLVKQGVSIGSGAVVGMGSVVTRDVEPYSIVAGNPAKKIRNRFDDDTIQKLLYSEWWNENTQTLNKMGKFVKSPDSFLKEIKTKNCM